jgi:hypothetical protein
VRQEEEEARPFREEVVEVEVHPFQEEAVEEGARHRRQEEEEVEEAHRRHPFQEEAVGEEVHRPLGPLQPLMIRLQEEVEEGVHHRLRRHRHQSQQQWSR